MFFLTLPLTVVGGLIVALAVGHADTLGADAGLLAVLVFAVRQGMLQIARIRRQHALDGGKLTPAIVTQAARDRLGPALGATIVTALALMPFVVMGDLPGLEIAHITAEVILGGLVSATLVNQLLLPAMCLALGPTMPQVVEDAPADEPVTATKSPTAPASVS
jgi:Cu/Ag efflux pump CusA